MGSGAKQFVLLHHSGCPRDGFHYRITASGSVEPVLAEDARGQHPHALGIVVNGNADEQAPTAKQLASLKALLIDLKLRYPDVVLGAHRQVRGDIKTTCPGRYFPMKEVAAWAKTQLLHERDAKLRATIESQYDP